MSEKFLSPKGMFVKRFFRDKRAVVGLFIIIFLFLFCFFGVFFSPYGEIEADLNGDTVVSVVENKTFSFTNALGEAEDINYYFISYSVRKVNKLQRPSLAHPFGTDEQGYDVLVRVMYGGQISLTIGFVVIILETFFGVLLGGLAGYFGKWVDTFIMRIVDIFYCVPTLPILLIASALFSSLELSETYRIYFLMIILTFFGWADTAQRVRGQILSLREQDFMLAASAMGLPASRKIFHHLIPCVIPQLIVTMTLGFSGVILMESTLSFLGLGVSMPYAAWGTMIGKITDFNILQNHFHLWAPPGICIVLAALSFNFIGEGVNGALR